MIAFCNGWDFARTFNYNIEIEILFWKEKKFINVTHYIHKYHTRRETKVD